MRFRTLALRQTEMNPPLKTISRLKFNPLYQFVRYQNLVLNFPIHTAPQFLSQTKAFNDLSSNANFWGRVCNDFWLFWSDKFEFRSVQERNADAIMSLDLWFSFGVPFHFLIGFFVPLSSGFRVNERHLSLMSFLCCYRFIFKTLLISLVVSSLGCTQ